MSRPRSRIFGAHQKRQETSNGMEEERFMGALYPIPKQMLNEERPF